jgi:hypothetical protein
MFTFLLQGRTSNTEHRTSNIEGKARGARHLLFALLLAAAVVLPRALLLRDAHSETSDDDYHLVRGLEFLHRDPGLVHRELNDPPLGEALAALPLWLLGGTTHGQDEGTALYAQTGYTPETALLLVTLWKSLLFLPLVAVAFLWTRRLYGLPSAWLAVGLLLVEPTIAAHLHLAALDVIATTGIVTACYLAWRFFEHPTSPRLVASALSCAAALLLKHTAILVPGIILAYALLHALRSRHRQSTMDSGPGAVPVPSMVNNLARGVLLTVLFMWVLLACDVSQIGRGRVWPGGLYIQSIFDAGRHVAEPNDAYLHGEVRRGGWWYYFPVVATYKVPIGVGVVLVLGLVSCVRRRPRWEEWGLLLPAAAYTLFMFSQSINIGWRHFLPPYVFLMLLATRCVASRAEHRTSNTEHPTSKPAAPRFMGALVVLALVATVLDTLRYHPDYLAYVNYPRANVHLAISDSNVDWGQGLKQANRWLDANTAFVGGRPVYLRAVADSNRAIRHYLGGRVVTKHFGYPCPRSGVLIVSPVAVAGLSESDDEYGFLRRAPQPYAIIGHALRVYDLDALAKQGVTSP